MAHYDIEGIEYPSVTEITGLLDKPHLMQWSAGLAAAYCREHASEPDVYERAPNAWREKSDQALDTGKKVHNIIEKIIKAKIIGETAVISNDLSSNVSAALEAFLTWERANVRQWIASEMQIVESVKSYAGTLDAIAILCDEKKYVIDFKSSNAIYPENIMQIAAYRYAMHDEEILGMGVLRLDKNTGLPQWRSYNNDAYCRQAAAFLTLLDFFYLAKKRRLKNNRRAK